MIKIHTLVELLTTLQHNTPQELEIQSSILVPQSIILPPGFSLKGANNDDVFLSFNSGDGIGLTADNTVSNLTIQANPNDRAIKED